MEGNKKVLKPSPVKSVASQAKRGVIDSCQLCQKRFSALRLEHQCKRCARAVCSDCSKAKAKVNKMNQFDFT